MFISLSTYQPLLYPHTYFIVIHTLIHNQIYLKMHTPTKPQLKGIGLYVVLIVIVRATSIVCA